MKWLYQGPKRPARYGDVEARSGRLCPNPVQGDHDHPPRSAKQVLTLITMITTMITHLELVGDHKAKYGPVVDQNLFDVFGPVSVRPWGKGVPHFPQISPTWGWLQPSLILESCRIVFVESSEGIDQVSSGGSPLMSELDQDLVERFLKGEEVRISTHARRWGIWQQIFTKQLNWRYIWKYENWWFLGMRWCAANHKISDPDISVWNGWCGTRQEGFVVSAEKLQSSRIS